jgi:DNA invertase Pin-like site-specific DNA recombinase
MSRALRYLRVSTSEQGDSGLGLDAQGAAIDAELAHRGWAPAGTHIDIASGKSTKGRPELLAALDALDRGEADVLVVAKLDRLARSVLDFANIMARAARAGWAIVCIDVNVDTSTASGEMMANVVAAFAQYERRLISDRTRAAMAAKRASGARLGRPVTLPANVRARIVREHRKGLSLRTIAAGLIADEIPTAQGGAKWHASTVKAVLASAELDAAA